MKIRIKRPALLSPKRTGFNCKIDKIEKRTSPKDSEKENLILFLKGFEKTGILIFNEKEMEMLSKHLTPKKAKEHEEQKEQTEEIPLLKTKKHKSKKKQMV